MQNEQCPVANPLVVLREEFDDWAILFDPDTGEAMGLNPVGVLVWKHLDGEHCLTDLVAMVRESCDDVPAEVEDHVSAFVQDLVESGLAGYELK